jgi:hypothetical protein
MTIVRHGRIAHAYLCERGKGRLAESAGTTPVLGKPGGADDLVRRNSTGRGQRRSHSHPHPAPALQSTLPITGRTLHNLPRSDGNAVLAASTHDREEDSLVVAGNDLTVYEERFVEQSLRRNDDGKQKGSIADGEPFNPESAHRRVDASVEDLAITIDVAEPLGQRCASARSVQGR